ncbi:transcriptional regulator [Bradyrhizobium ottawaense]|uniref:transcriptional regulator n=1 Tax=Bradyrhizobium ottawaense TaxID=931866 RepID=UPI0030F38556
MRSFSIDEWCQLHGFCRAFFYKLRAQGQAPRTYNVGRIVRISEEANNEWLRAREAPSQVVAA